MSLRVPPHGIACKHPNCLAELRADVRVTDTMARDRGWFVGCIDGERVELCRDHKPTPRTAKKAERPT